MERELQQAEVIPADGPDVDAFLTIAGRALNRILTEQWREDAIRDAPPPPSVH